MVKDRPLRELIPALADRRPFTLSRWGDHEWQVLFGDPAAGLIPKDGFVYLVELQQELWKVLNARPDYRLALSTEDTRATNTIFAVELEKLDWCRDPLLAIGGRCPELDALAEAASRKPLILVGPPKYRHLRRQLKYRAFVDVPPKNAYLCRDHLVREILAAVDDLKEPALISISAGVCAPLLIHDLYPLLGNFHQLVDFGGVWGEYLWE